MSDEKVTADSRSATLHSTPSSLHDETKDAHAPQSGKEAASPLHEEIRFPGETHAEAVNDLELKRIQTSDSTIEYPKGAKLGLITLALCLSIFCMAIDNTIIATAIPKITDEFHSLPDVGWYGSAYLLTTAAFQLLFGKFYSFFSIKWVYLIAIGIFELGSLICGAAPNSTALIVGRAIAGIGSAGIFSGALIIVAYSVPLVQRPIYSGMIGAMYGIASVAGPLLGGVFTDKATWRWCFYINLPIGAITVAVMIFFFTAPDRKAVATLTWRERIIQLDLIGTVLFMPAVVCLLLALQWGGSKYAWADGRIIALFVLAGVLVIAFIGVQFWRGDQGTVPPRIIAKRSIWAASFFAFCLGAAFFIMIYYLPIWFQAVQGATAVESGIRNLPMVLGLVIMSILSGIGVTLLGYYTPFMIICSCVMAIGFGLITTFTPQTQINHWLGYQALAGLGIGIGMQQPLMAVQTVLDITDVPTGTSLLIFLQTLGGALFVSVGQNVFTNELLKNLAVYAPDINAADVLTVGATSLQTTAEFAKDLAGVVLAYNNALVVTFRVATAMAALSIIGALAIEWKSMKGKKVVPAAV